LVLALLAVGLTAAGLATAATLRGYLTSRVDQQLQTAAQGLVEHGLGPQTPPPEGDAGDHLPSAFVVEVATATGAPAYGPTSNLLRADQPLPKLPKLTPAQAGKHHGKPFTVSAVRGSTPWRVLALPFSDGSGTLLVAMSLADVQSTVGHLELLELLVGLAVVAVLVGVGNVVLHASLRPLREVEQTAGAIAAGDLSQRVRERDRRTEVGRLAAAINSMLSQIETAFRAQAKSEAQARTSEERMRRFVADASHELRTPLTSIRGFAELYRQGAVSDTRDIDRAMQRIEDEAARMGVLVNDLLLLARLDQQRPLRRAPVDLLTLANDAVHDIRATAPDRAVTLEVPTVDPPPLVNGDEDRLRQVLANLLSNAVRHTPAGSPVTVRVYTRVDAGGMGWAVLEVADHGPGLSPADATRIFERFYRADESRSREDGGAGLGLSIVATIAAAHEGRASVDTAPGEGATFRVELPLLASADPATEAAAAVAD
jgi:two-component system OmpR family sensor kinase